jgi:FtsH-binding integral membrane protein
MTKPKPGDDLPITIVFTLISAAATGLSAYRTYTRWDTLSPCGAFIAITVVALALFALAMSVSWLSMAAYEWWTGEWLDEEE